MVDEYIRKADTVDEINANADDLEQNGSIPYAQGARAMAIVVEQMPPADVALVRHARWRHYEGMYACEDCGAQLDDESPFCPMCGAKMDGGCREE
jgi:predicted RNA-binding Zn-ribbon protein involved in translation (DUF1610 family)